MSKCPDAKSHNLLAYLHNRKYLGAESKYVPSKVSPYRIHKLSDTVNSSQLAEGHIFLGFSNCGTFLYSYTIVEGNDIPLSLHESEDYDFYLHWWTTEVCSSTGKISFVKKFSRPVRNSACHKLFIVLYQWHNDSSKIVLMSGEKWTDFDASRSQIQCFSILPNPPKLGDCSLCRLATESYDLCKAHSYNIQFYLELPSASSLRLFMDIENTIIFASESDVCMIEVFSSKTVVKESSESYFSKLFIDKNESKFLETDTCIFGLDFTEETLSDLFDYFSNNSQAPLSKAIVNFRVFDKIGIQFMELPSVNEVSEKFDLMLHCSYLNCDRLMSDFLSSLENSERSYMRNYEVDLMNVCPLSKGLYFEIYVVLFNYDSNRYSKTDCIYYWDLETGSHKLVFKEPWLEQLDRSCVSNLPSSPYSKGNQSRRSLQWYPSLPSNRATSTLHNFNFIRGRSLPFLFDKANIRAIKI